MCAATAQISILVVEDEPDVLAVISNRLTAEGFTVHKLDSGTEAITMARQLRPSLIVLDVMLPGMNGFDICKVLKQDEHTEHIPILMLTALSSEADRVRGLELGADDYLTKPFSPRELVLRIRVLLRTHLAVPPRNDLLSAGDITVSRSRLEVKVSGKSLDLTATELKLLVLLIERRGRLQSRDVLLNEVWGYETAIETRTVDSHMARLRNKLGDAAEIIETVRGVGYRIPEAREHSTALSIRANGR